MARLAIDSQGRQTIVDNFDRFTGQPFNAEKVTKWHDGTDMDDSKVDNVIYFKAPSNLGGGYAKRNEDWKLNAKWFGAKGDGVTDDTLSIRKAIDSLKDSSVLYFPPGKYKISRNAHSPLAIEGINTYVLRIMAKKNLTISGYGAEIIQPDVDVDGVSLGIFNCENVHIEGLEFDGEHIYDIDNEINHKQQLFHLIKCQKISIMRCSFRRASGAGLLITNMYKKPVTRSPNNDNVIIFGCTFENITQATTYGAGTALMRIIGNSFKNTYLSAFKLSSDQSDTIAGDDMQYRDVVISDNIAVWDDNYVNPNNGGVPNNYFTGIDCVSNVKSLIITNNILEFDGHGPSGTGIKINWAESGQSTTDIGYANKNILITGNIIRNLSSGSAAIQLSPYVSALTIANNLFENCHNGIRVNVMGASITGFEASTHIIESNQFINIGNANIITDSLFIYNMLIKNNSCSGSGDLQFIYINSNCNVTNLVIENNDSNKNISINKFDKLLIKNNNISTTSSVAIFVDGAEKQADSVAIISGNTVMGGNGSLVRNCGKAVFDENKYFCNGDQKAARFSLIDNLYISANVIESASGNYGLTDVVAAFGNYNGTGVPELELANGSQYSRLDGSGDCLYLRRSGNWIAIG